MTIGIRHTFHSVIVDDGAAAAAGEVLPSHWNADHTIDDSGVTAATYGNGTHVPQIAVDAKGRITGASNVAISGGGMAIGGAVTGGTASDFLFVDNSGNLGQLGSVVTAIANGGTYAIPGGVWLVALNQNGIAGNSSITITMPSSPYDGQIIFVAINSAVGSLFVTAPGGATVHGVATDSFTVTGGVFYGVYHSASTEWECGSGSLYRLAIGNPVAGVSPGDILIGDSSNNLANVASSFLSYNPATGEFLAQMQSGANWIWMPPGFIELAHDTGIKFSHYAGLGAVADYNITQANTWTFKTLVLVQGGLQTQTFVQDISYHIDTPTVGATVTIPDSIYTEIIDPAGALATLTIKMPASPVDGQIVRIKFSQTITALTLSPNTGQSLKGSLTTAALGAIIDCQYVAGSTTWYC